jgi:hypothetical protein
MGTAVDEGTAVGWGGFVAGADGSVVGSAVGVADSAAELHAGRANSSNNSRLIIFRFIFSSFGKEKVDKNIVILFVNFVARLGQISDKL